ncbi:hypothetical protein ACX6XY_19130 [Streptomyces sp. O3]
MLWDLDAETMDELFGTGLNALRESLGLPPVARFRGHVLTDRPWLAAGPVLSPWREPADGATTAAKLLLDQAARAA